MSCICCEYFVSLDRALLKYIYKGYQRNYKTLKLYFKLRSLTRGRVAGGSVGPGMFYTLVPDPVMDECSDWDQVFSERSDPDPVSMDPIPFFLLLFFEGQIRSQFY